MKTIIKSTLALTLLISGDAFASENNPAINGQPTEFKTLRSTHSSGGTTQGGPFSLTGSIGQHSSQTSTGGNWQLIAGLITPQRGWPNDLIYNDAFETNFNSNNWNISQELGHE